MKYALTFSLFTCGYSVHATDCVACCSTKKKVRLSDEFDTIEHARQWAHDDEYEKGAKDRSSARVTVCKCTKPRESDR